MNHYHHEFILRSWTPAEISNATHWWDASDESTITDDGDGTVNNFADKIGSLDFAQASAGAQPDTGTRTINGRNVLDFDGSDYMQTGTFTHPASYHIFIVTEVDTVNSDIDCLMSVDNSNDANIGWQFRSNSATDFIGQVAENTAGWGSTLDATSGNQEGNTVLWDFYINSGSDGELFLNGASEDTNTVSNTDTQGNANLNLYANRATTQFPNGCIAEVLFCDAEITGDDLTRARNYFAVKWGITLS